MCALTFSKINFQPHILYFEMRIYYFVFEYTFKIRPVVYCKCICSELIAINHAMYTHTHTLSKERPVIGPPIITREGR